MAKRIHYYIDGDNAACGIEYDGEDNFTDDDSEITCRKCIARWEDYEEELEDEEEEEEDRNEYGPDDETEQEELPSAIAAPVAPRRPSVRYIVTNAPRSLDMKLHIKDLGVQGLLHDLELRKVLVQAGKADEQLELYKSRDKGIPCYFAEYDEYFVELCKTDPAFKASIKQVIGDDDMAVRRNTRTPAVQPTVVAPAVQPEVQAPVVPAPAPAVVKSPLELAKERQRIAMEQTAAARRFTENAQAESVRTPGVTVGTPNTPAPKAPEADVENGQTVKRVTKLEAQYAELSTYVSDNKFVTRLASVEDAVETFQTDYAALVGGIQEMHTLLTASIARIAELETEVANYSVLGLPQLDLEGINPGNAPEPEPEPVVPAMSALDAILAFTPDKAPVAPPVVRAPQAAQKTGRQIPARGTGVMAQYSNEDCAAMLALYKENYTMKQIGEMYGIDSTKTVWHCIERIRNPKK